MRDSGSALCDRVEARDYKECGDDIQDAVVDYQVDRCNAYTAAVSPS